MRELRSLVNLPRKGYDNHPQIARQSPAIRRLTFDMSGGPKGAKQPLERPLDGGVRRHCKDAHDGCGMLCHQIWHFLHKPPSNSALSRPSRTIRGSGSPAFRATRFVPVDLAQIWKSSSEATW